MKFLRGFHGQFMCLLHTGGPSEQTQARTRQVSMIPNFLESEKMPSYGLTWNGLGTHTIGDTQS